MGRVAQQSNDDLRSMDISPLENGMYIITFSIKSGEVLSEKIIKL